MLRRALALLALPIVALAAQSSALTLTITTSDNQPFFIVQAPSDSARPVEFARGKMVVHYFAPMRPKSFTVIARDSLSSVSVTVSDGTHDLASGTGAYVRVSTDTSRFARLEAGTAKSMVRGLSDASPPGDDTGKLGVVTNMKTGEVSLVTMYQLGRKP